MSIETRYAIARAAHLIGIIAVVATVILGLAGAGSASASTALCKANELPCAEANQYGSISYKGQLATFTNATFLTSVGNIVCTGSEFSGQSNGGLAESSFGLEGKLLTLTFTGCKLGTSKCTVKAEFLWYWADISYVEGTMNGLLRLSDPQIHVTECLNLNCVFWEGFVYLDIQGGKPASVVASEEELLRTEGIFCPSAAIWDAEYHLSSPESLYVSS